MAKGHQANQERLTVLNSFGKDLIRRAKSKCELSEVGGQALKIYEIPPLKEPEYGRCLMLSEKVIDQLERPKSIDAEQWRHLAELVWVEEPAVLVMVVRMLAYLSKEHTWAGELLADASIDDEILEWAAEAPLLK